MKKSILYLFVATCISFSVKAQYVDESKVPATVKNAFAKKYPGITPQWELEDGRFDAEFKENDKKRSILFDRKGNSFEQTKVNGVEVPTALVDYINTNYKGEKLKKVKKLVGSNGEVSYLGVMESKSIHFDANGKFIDENKN
jgi:hypothetical protein